VHLADGKLLVNRTSGNITMSGKGDTFISKLFPKNFEFPDNFGIDLSVLNDYVDLRGDIKASNIRACSIYFCP